MSKVVELLKKTPLRRAWWKVKKLPPLKKLRKYISKKRKDRLLYHTLPAVYEADRGRPVEERKVLFIELRLPEISNSFRVMYDLLQSDYDLDIHVHLLRDTFVKRKQYVENCKKMLADAATAKYIFVNEASDVLSCVDIRPETVVTQLWHACGAFKKFGMSTAERIFGPNEQELRRHPNNRNYTYVTVSSPEVIWAYAEAMDLKGREDIIKPTGTSRTDVFYCKETVAQAFDHLYQVFPAARGKKVILYAPTFRGRVARARTPDCFDLELFAQQFQEEYVVIFKHHPLVKKLPEIPQHLLGSFAIDATKSMTIEDLLCVSDICISDYSSLVFEYSLFERPMLFYAYDLDSYFDWRGFYYNYDELTPGPVCSTNEEMVDYIAHLDERFDRQVVHAFKEKFMSACDGHATERIVSMVFGEETERLENERGREKRLLREAKRQPGKPVISVVMPVFNAQDYLRETLDDVVNQTFPALELICVDDGSTDDSCEIIREFMREDARITLISQNNRYAGAARSSGFARSTGKYVVFWDSDDRFDHRMLEKMYRKITEDEADIAVCDIRKWDSNADAYVLPSNYLRREFLPENLPFSVRDIPQYIFNFTTGIVWNKMFRSEFIRKNGLRFGSGKRANDVLFTLPALCLAGNITVVNERLATYRYNNSFSLTGTLSSDVFCTYDAYRETYENLRDRGAFCEEKVLQSFANKALNMMVQSLDLQKTQADAQLLYDRLLCGGFEEIGICERGADYYYSVKCYQSYQSMLHGSLTDTLIVMKQQKEQNLEAHRQRLCGQRKKNEEMSAKLHRRNEELDRKKRQLDEKKEELAFVRSQTLFRALRKFGLLKEKR